MRSTTHSHRAARSPTSSGAPQDGRRCHNLGEALMVGMLTDLVTDDFQIRQREDEAPATSQERLEGDHERLAEVPREN